MKGYTPKESGTVSRLLREYRTEGELRTAWRNGDLTSSEMMLYAEWRRGDLKDTRITIRMSGSDRMKLQALARMLEIKLYSYIGEILRREIHFQEDRMAGDGNGS